MSYTFHCDFCGGLIEKGAPYATVTAEHTNEKGLRKRQRWTSGYLGHYHEPDCWRAVYDAMMLVGDAGQDLAAIPTMTQGQYRDERDRLARETWDGPDGIALLELRSDISRALWQADVLTITQAREKLARGEKFKGLGPQRVEQLREALEAHDAIRPREETT